MDDQKLGLGAFREQIKTSREAFPHHWEASRKLMMPETFQATLPALLHRIQEESFEPALRERLLHALHSFSTSSGSKEGNRILKDLTGLPPSEAVRALLVWGLLAVEGEGNHLQNLSDAQCEDIIRSASNPYDVLCHTPTPSLLDIGAGDLSFEQELADMYVPILQKTSIPLTLHAFDRLMPGSKVGGVYHKNVDCERYLQSFSSEKLQFKFWGGLDLKAFSKVKGQLPSYTISTCHAPANPAFAYEPSRVAFDVIQAYLRASRGDYRLSRYEGEPVLEVRHQGRILMFSDWKFEIVGPLALLEFMAKRCSVGILSAIDDEVFWEMLSQMLADDRYRPVNTIFTKDLLPEIFGNIYQELSSMMAGERKDLSLLTDLRAPMPFEVSSQVLGQKEDCRPCRFQHVEIRRGAVLEGVPGSFTARQFSQMKEESLPWWIIFIPDR